MQPPTPPPGSAKAQPEAVPSCVMPVCSILLVLPGLCIATPGPPSTIFRRICLFPSSPQQCFNPLSDCSAVARSSRQDTSRQDPNRDDRIRVCHEGMILQARFSSSRFSPFQITQRDTTRSFYGEPVSPAYESRLAISQLCATPSGDGPADLHLILSKM